VGGGAPELGAGNVRAARVDERRPQALPPRQQVTPARIRPVPSRRRRRRQRRPSVISAAVFGGRAAAIVCPAAAIVCPAAAFHVLRRSPCCHRCGGGGSGGGGIGVVLGGDRAEDVEELERGGPLQPGAARRRGQLG
jgi:hypothetical protein